MSETATEASTAPDTPTGGSRIAQLRRERRRKFAMSFARWVLAPTAVAVIYFGGFATEQYESTATFTVESVESQSGAGFESLLGVLPTSGSTRDTLTVRDYILSRDMLNRLVAEHGFDQHYSDSGVDFWARMDAEGDSEKRFEYYLERVRVDHDSQSGNLTLRVRGFSAADAQRVSQAILGYSEEMVNNLSKRARRDQLAFAQEEVDSAEKRVVQARDQIAKLQTEGREFNPEARATALVGVQSELEVELARARADLAGALANMQPTAPKVLELKQRVSGLKRQIDRQRERLVDPSTDEGLHRSVAEFQTATMEFEFAQSAYRSALVSLEGARAEASRQHRYLNTISKPSAPSAPTHPNKPLGILTVLVSAFALFGVQGLLVASVREHAKL